MAWRTALKTGALALFACVLIAASGDALLRLPGVISPSGCFTSAVLSTDQFTTTGFSQVRTVGPGDEAPAGAWVLADDWVPATSVVATVNCPPGGVDGVGTFVVGLRLVPTISSWQDADIQELKLVEDTNCNGLFEDGLDATVQVRSGAELASGRGVTFFNGPQSALLVVGSAGGGPAACGTSAIAVLAVVKIGPHPVSGARFGLTLEAAAADVPGRGIVSSGFASSLNPQASSIRLQIVGGGSGTPPPGRGSSPLKRFDANGNDLVDDQEFFTIIDAWIAGSLDDQTFFKAVDLWVSQGRISQAALRPGALELNAVELRANSIGGAYTFTARGRGIASTRLEVFDLSGRRIFSRESEGDRLVWPLSTNSGGLVANGVYLYRVTVQGANGETVTGRVKKLAVYQVRSSKF